MGSNAIFCYYRCEKNTFQSIFIYLFYVVTLHVLNYVYSNISENKFQIGAVRYKGLIRKRQNLRNDPLNKQTNNSLSPKRSFPE